jgi:hypothetical protein
MHKLRLKYLLCVVATIAAGLLSRKITVIPAWVGDSLWAMMIYMLLKIVFIRASVVKVIAFSLAFCFTIEISQLYQAPWINQIRSTLIGHLILGQGFLWSDLLAYTGGVLLIAMADGMLSAETERFNE